jgi:hypothetical protein
MPGGETGSEPGPVDAAAVRDGARTRVGSERARTRRRPRRRPVEGESTATLF